MVSGGASSRRIATSARRSQDTAQSASPVERRKGGIQIQRGGRPETGSRGGLLNTCAQPRTAARKMRCAGAGGRLVEKEVGDGRRAGTGAGIAATAGRLILMASPHFQG